MADVHWIIPSVLSQIWASHVDSRKLRVLYVFVEQAFWQSDLTSDIDLNSNAPFPTVTVQLTFERI